ncbi:hydrogenase expression protein [Actinoplanes cyaneus]|uniref:Hydrogenase expression protein n=1 Tax=Actinoplanes cyaneus TaxID=52696 RepID=A0A919IME2_9ACTN|nr:efflux RND transporter permease subunit [Actinoplanes cyaneus]MCW2141383.1 hydrophobic/amphiphilic exporter-1, HAE1 family [Actinoplanes cyaneus]GID68043.1 hydrogenase expression protein [Actinoplanes cyaneus]
MSALTRLSLANRGLVALIAIVISGFGLFAIPSLKQQLFPSIELPAAFVSAVLPGASPETVEEQVTKPIEDAVKGIDGIDSVTSTSRENATSVVVLFEYGTDIESAVNQVTTSINRIQSQLPEDVDPQVFAGGTDDIPAIVLAASGGSDESDLLNKLNETVVPELNGITGVRDTQVTGARGKQVVITPNLAKMGAAGIAPTSLTTVLQANGVSIPAGAVTDGSKSLTVQVGTPITTVEQLRDVYLTGTRSPVRLGDVATVESKLPAAEAYTRTDGKDSLGIAVTARPDGNPVEISHQVRDMLADLEKDSGAKLTVITDQAPFVERSIKSLTTEGLLGLVMAVVVILIFLMSVRSTLVTAVSIPLSVLVALIALWVGDYTLNLLTLGALTIAVGRVVDDSIVVLENIKRHLEYGEEKMHAILAAVREVSGAVTASTLTTVAVFAPIALVGGLIGQIFSSFAITVTVALLASLFVALTVVPVLAYWFLRPPKGSAAEAEAIRKAAEEKELRSPLQRGYLPVIRFATTRRWATVLIGIAVLIGTFALSTRLETNFLDESGQDSITVTQELPVGTSLAATDEAAKKVEAIIAGRDDVTTYQVTVGGNSANPFAGGGGAGTATFNVALDEDADAEKISDELRAEFGKLTDAGEIKIGQESSGLGSSQLSVEVTAADNDVLASATDQVRTAMAGIGGVADVDTTLAASVPRLDVIVDRKAAAAAGLTEAQIGQTVAGMFRSAPAGQISIDGASEDVVISFGAAPADTTALKALPLTTPKGVVPLSSVAEVKQVNGPEQVTRTDGNRTATVTGSVTGSNLSQVNTDLTKKLDALDLPAGASYKVGGVSADQADAFKQLGLAVLAAIAIVFIIMVATFRSIVQPIILLVSIPFAATGAIGLLLATGTPLGVPALIGVLMLVGIVVTNAIVLMDLINHYRADGMGVQQAVIEGGRHRLRPILMTAIATIFALIPMALGLTGEGGFISQPLAIVVIGGLVSSTLLTLVLVPTLYTMVETRKEKRRAKREAKRARKAGLPETPAAQTPAAHTPGPEAAEPVTVPDDAPAQPGGNGALRGYTDQFEVLKMPKGPEKPSEK